ncbi:MAG: MFS transporter [Bullifex sp.]
MAEKQLKKTNPLRYAVGMFGTSIPINMFKTYAAYFYVDSLGLITTPQFSLILFIYTFLDAIDNPVYGFLSDRTRSAKWGRRKPWLIIAAPLLVLAFIMFFNPPSSLAPGSAFSYILIMYLLTGTLDSLINVNYGALFPELFRTQEERARTNASRQIFQFIAMIISIALTPVITDAIGFRMTSLLYGALAITVIWFMATGCHEDQHVQGEERPHLLSSIIQIARNPKFWVYGLTNSCYYGALALVQSGVAFYSKYHLGQGGLGSTILLGTVIISAIVFIPVWVKVMKRFSLMPSFRSALVICALSIIPLYFVHSLPLAVVTVVFFGLGMGGVSCTMDVAGARIMDDDYEKNGVKREGLFSSLNGILNKVSGLITSLAFFLVFSIYGFESGANPGPDPDGASVFLTVLFPISFFIAGAIISLFLRFDEKEGA